MVERIADSEENLLRIADVESSFAGGVNEVFVQPLAKPGRVLIGEGVLTKMCRKKPKPRQFYLFNDILVYGDIIMSKKAYIKQRILPLEDITVEDLADDGVMKHGWLIRTPSKSFAVYATSASEKQEWTTYMIKYGKEQLEKTGKIPEKENAAVWTPNSEASICMNCRKTQFSLLKRKHHCRKCGSVVCKSCSSNKYLIVAVSPRPQRVCDTCYDKLTAVRPPIVIRPVPPRPPAIKTIGRPVSPLQHTDLPADLRAAHVPNSSPHLPGVQGSTATTGQDPAPPPTASPASSHLT
ncbi:PLEKHF2 [Cordylochernes scorpioides]|uniref:PLEKHF2 n=1 Tax=Cordylochernes scorpioides TaxID=51811 RepID=A0ABY6KY99_9ARAC|nr:PLEKHF2 [Cordylochernes scorpioides]